MTDPADMFASQDNGDKPLREVREMIAHARSSRSYLGGAGEFFGEIADSSQILESSQISGRPKRGIVEGAFGCPTPPEIVASTNVRC